MKFMTLFCSNDYFKHTLNFLDCNAYKYLYIFTNTIRNNQYLFLILQKKHINIQQQAKNIRNGIKYRYLQQYSPNFLQHRGIIDLRIYNHRSRVKRHFNNAIEWNLVYNVYGNSKLLFKSILGVVYD